jgi:hypothetical protein
MESGGFIGDAEVNVYVNESWGELYDILVTADYFLSSVDFSLAGGASGYRYTFPTSLYKLRSLERNPDTSNRLELERVPFSERNGIGYRGYILIGSTIEVHPFENAAGDYRAYYVPERPVLSVDGDSISVPNGWEAFVTLGAAIKMLAKEESDSSALQREQAQIRAGILSHVERDSSRPARVGDVYLAPGNPSDVPWDYR